MEIIQTFLNTNEIPSPFNYIPLLIGSVLLISTSYSFFVRVLVTSKFEKLFFSKSELVEHKTKRFIAEMLIFQVLIIIYSVLQLSLEVGLNRTFLIILLTTFFVTILFALVILFFVNVKENFNFLITYLSKLVKTNKIRKHNKENYKHFHLILIMLNMFSGVFLYQQLVYVFIFNFRNHEANILDFLSDSTVISTAAIILITPYLFTFTLYKPFIEKVLKKRNEFKEQYLIKKFDSNFLNENNLVTYYSINKHQIVLVTADDINKNEYQIDNFFLYDFSNDTLYRFDKQKAKYTDL